MVDLRWIKTAEPSNNHCKYCSCDHRLLIHSRAMLTNQFLKEYMCYKETHRRKAECKEDPLKENEFLLHGSRKIILP